MNHRQCLVFLIVLGFAQVAQAENLVFSDLARISPGKTAAQNSLWCENPPEKRFDSTNSVVVADITGPAEITMIHFAMPSTLRLGREAMIRAYWDDETEPSLDCPLVDFFCDPNGAFETIETALVNKCRGFNAYFTMPFRRRGKIVLDYDGDIPPGDELVARLPCYCYVMYRQRDSISEDEGYFHAFWRQESLQIDEKEYVALQARGKGKFVGWNVTLRNPGRRNYPVDMNEWFHIDGEETPSIEFQGIEDAFGFSWGFPSDSSEFLLAGYRPFMKGAACYRFFLNDAIRFDESLRVSIGFGENENDPVQAGYGTPNYFLEFSSVVYWYQSEPHAAFPKTPSLAERRPAPDDNPLWPDTEVLPRASELRDRGVRFLMLCGRPGTEVVFAEEGYALKDINGYAWEGFPPPVYHCRAHAEDLEIVLSVPAEVSGTLRLYVVDPDRFKGGRKQEMSVNGRRLGDFEDFGKGQWIEAPLDSQTTKEGEVTVRAKNLVDGGNAVVSFVEWVEKDR